MVWVMLLSPFSASNQGGGSKGDTKEKEEEEKADDGHGEYRIFYSSQPAT